MTRTIPSIIVLAFMCFTICYGLVQFPDAGILDASAAPSLPTDGPHIVNKQTPDGSAIQSEQTPQTSVLPKTQEPSNELFITESSLPPTKGSDSAAKKDVVDNSANNAQENNPTSESNVGGDSTKENSKPDHSNSTIDESSNKADNRHVDSEPKVPELPKENKTNNNSNEQTESLEVIGISENEDFISDDSLPIDTDHDPFSELNQENSDVPTIFVEQTPPEPEPLMDPAVEEQEELPTPESMPESGKSSDDFWDEYLNENSPTNSLPSNNDKPKTDSASASETQKQEPSLPGIIDIKTDPNAQEIPPSNREKKSANTGALTQPAVGTPQNNNANDNIPKTGTIPIETFPLDVDDYSQQTNFSIEYQEPYDRFGFNIPATGPIKVRRFPSIENSVDPLYNNAQLDRFAL